MISKILLLVKQICPATTQIDNLRTSIPIMFQARTLEAIESIGDPLPTADHTLVLVVAEAALVADAHEGCRPHIGVAYGAFAVALVAQASDGDARLLAAHYEIGVVAGHGGGGERREG